MKARSGSLAIGLALVCGIAFAQTAPAPAAPTPQPPAATPTPGAGMGMGMGQGRGGMGMGRGGAGMQFDATNTPGWALMTPEERVEHQNKMRSMKSRDECNAYMVEHKVQIATRAAERKVQLRTPRRDMCTQMFPQ